MIYTSIMFGNYTLQKAGMVCDKQKLFP